MDFFLCIVEGSRLCAWLGARSYMRGFASSAVGGKRQRRIAKCEESYIAVL